MVTSAFSDLAGVAGGLWDPAPEGRRAAAQAAACFPDSVPLLVARLRVETDPKVFGALESSLVSIGSDAVVMGVVPLLRACEPAVRIVGTDILRVLGERSEPVARALLTDIDPALRMIGVTIVRGLPTPEAPDWLLDVLRRDPNPTVCVSALECLAEIARPDMAPAVRAARDRFSDSEEFAAGIDQVLRVIDPGVWTARAP
ncbi:HEAT repeat domain-containing protein [Pararhodospirillum photometricum]|uniref:HEAT repeat domain-containing protein n=1 Tax=Pararhodospirillum photometricum TaxID=1084 RepID=UPI0002DEDC53|nr:HEAT repeat domain-containing protein [Pararhodospirillum photometricum]